MTADTVLAIAEYGSAAIGVGFILFEVGLMRGLRVGSAIYRKPLVRTCRRAAKYHRLWLYHREKGARLRRRLWEIRKALDGCGPGERNDP